MRGCLFLLASLLAVPAAVAAPIPGGNEFACNYDGNQQEMNACAFRDYKSADRKLNRVYRFVLSGLPPSKQVSLRREQHQWLIGRDSKFKAEVAQSEGGSNWPLEHFGCLQATTDRRTQQVKSREWCGEV